MEYDVLFKVVIVSISGLFGLILFPFAVRLWLVLFREVRRKRRMNDRYDQLIERFDEYLELMRRFAPEATECPQCGSDDRVYNPSDPQHKFHCNVCGTSY